MMEQPLYLVMVTSDANHNKFYRMIPNGDTFTVQYGRVGNDYVATIPTPSTCGTKN